MNRAERRRWEREKRRRLKRLDAHLKAQDTPAAVVEAFTPLAALFDTDMHPLMKAIVEGMGSPNAVSTCCSCDGEWVRSSPPDSFIKASFAGFDAFAVGAVCETCVDAYGMEAIVKHFGREMGFDHYEPLTATKH